MHQSDDGKKKKELLISTLMMLRNKFLMSAKKRKKIYINEIHFHEPDKGECARFRFEKLTK
jgi:hypothetical protein